MNYKGLADVLYPELVEYVLRNHREEITEMYKEMIDEFLMAELGTFDEKASSKLTKELLKRLVS
tara:strand:+ start:883 stop:1074 length:192 start_codon:yes stop_codon:yes gene_type:complete